MLTIKTQQKGRRGKLRKYRVHSPLAIVLFAGILAVFYPAYVWNKQLDQQLSRLEKDRGQLMQKNLNLQEKVRKLNTPDYVEQLARQELGLVKPGEVQSTPGIPDSH